MVKSLYKKVTGFLRNEEGQMQSVGAMYAVIFMIVLVFIAVVLFTFIPGMGATIATSVPGAPAYCTVTTNATTCAASQVSGGQWNTSDLNNPNQAALASASGVSLWTSSSGMFKISIIITILALVIGALLGMLAIRRSSGHGGGM